jgi:hypothetical protein
MVFINGYGFPLEGYGFPLHGKLPIMGFHYRLIWAKFEKLFSAKNLEFFAKNFEMFFKLHM